MNFGRIEASELSQVDFTLPSDTALTLKTLSKSEVKPLEVHIGGTQWGVKEWQGSIYPHRRDMKSFLYEYAKQFNCIELGATFYTMPKEVQVVNWKEQADINPSFKFCPKFPQSITHIRRLKNAEALTTEFYKAILSLGNCLGPILLQLSDGFSPKSFDNLKDFLIALPKDTSVAVELRHKDWFADKNINQMVFNLFEEIGIGTAISDAAGRRDCVHMNLTTPDAYIRFVGNGMDKGDQPRLDEWVNRIIEWKELGLRSLWFMMHQNNDKQTPLAIDYLAKELNDKLGLNIQRPRFSTEPNLFS